MKKKFYEQLDVKIEKKLQFIFEQRKVRFTYSRDISIEMRRP